MSSEHSTGNAVSACTGKVRFDDYSTADKAANRKSRRTTKKSKPYHCLHCNGWHLGVRLAGGHLDARFKREKQGVDHVSTSGIADAAESAVSE